MTRSIAGVFRSRARADRGRLERALEPRASRLIELRQLAVAHTGPPARADGPLCLLAGRIDDTARLTDELNCREGSSAEQLLAAGYLRWGASLLERIRGEFLLLLWDRERGEGLIARDQLGVASLYVHDAGGTLYFATEVRELLALLPRRPAPDAAGVAHWLAASNRTGDGTLYEGVRRVLPGGVLLLGGEGVRERRYWSPTFVEPPQCGESELAEQVREGLGRAVRRRLADRAIEGGGRHEQHGTGVLMSGGLDSAAVAAIAAREAPGRVAAFSGVFPEQPAADESGLIAGLRGALGLPGMSAEVRPGGLLASALESQHAWQLPLLSWGDFWTLPLLRAAASAGVRVVLGGDGGDELFATRVYLLADRLRGARPLDSLCLARELPGAGEAPPRRELLSLTAQLAIGGALPYRPHQRWRRLSARRTHPAWLTRRVARELCGSEDPLAWKRLDGPRWWAHAADGLTSGIDQVGIFEMHRHRAALAGLQARHPLFDLDLLETVLRQPPTSTFNRHHNRPLLRAGMAGLLPDAVRLRPRKALFDSLIIETLAGPDAPAVRRLLADPRAELGGYVDLAAMRRSLLDDDVLRAGRPFEWMQHLWRLVTAECWLRAQSDPEHERLRASLRPSPPHVALRACPARASGPAPERPSRPPILSGVEAGA
jgi:asparagine synthase (glutamine-hydrolysing)